MGPRSCRASHLNSCSSEQELSKDLSLSMDSIKYNFVIVISLPSRINIYLSFPLNLLSGNLLSVA